MQLALLVVVVVVVVDVVVKQEQKCVQEISIALAYSKSQHCRKENKFYCCMNRENPLKDFPSNCFWYIVLDISRYIVVNRPMKMPFT